MKTEIRRCNPALEYATDERCYILELANDAGDEAVSIAQARVPPGVTTAWHRVHGTDERYIIVSGAGRMEIAGSQPTEVGPGDVVRIPAQAAQRITNTGQADLIFYCVCSPRFRRENYELLE